MSGPGAVAVGIDVGGTTIKMGLVDRNGQVLARRRIAYAAVASFDALAETLAADVDALADAMTGPGEGPGVEIERKYLLSALPARARKAPVKDIWQGWIPGEKLHERLRVEDKEVHIYPGYEHGESSREMRADM